MQDDNEETAVAQDPAAPLEFKRTDLLSTGSTLLNLIISGDPFGGFLKGKYFFMVGDSTSGKTFLSMSCFAEATINEQFSAYRLIYDNIEDGMLMNLDKLFSEEVADRVEPPRTADGRPVFSDTAENFYFHLDDAIYQAGWDAKAKKASDVKSPRPFIYVLDSENSLDSDASDKKFYEHKDASRKVSKTRRRGENGDQESDEPVKVAGSMGDGKAKLHSERMRRAMKGLRKTGSILIVLSQTRQNIGGYGPKKTRPGGDALRFYSTVEIWSSVAEHLKTKVNGRDRKNGVCVKLETRKNRITGLLADAEIDIFPSFGIDDLGTCVDFLVQEGHWQRMGDRADSKIKAVGLGIEGTRDKIIRLVEKKNLEEKLRGICGDCWANIQRQLTVKRKNRYSRQPDKDEDDA